MAQPRVPAAKVKFPPGASTRARSRRANASGSGKIAVILVAALAAAGLAAALSWGGGLKKSPSAPDAGATAGAGRANSGGGGLATTAIKKAAPVVVPVIRPAQAPEKDRWEELPGFRLDFENYQPGQAVTEWKYSWGEMGNNLLIATADAASRGKRSLLFDRSDDESKGMWGAAVRFPPLPERGGLVRFDFLYQGRGNESSFSFEIRDGGPRRLVTFGVGNNRAGFNLHGVAKKSKKERVRDYGAGNVRPGVWYRVEVEFLAAMAAQRELADAANPDAGAPAAEEDEVATDAQRAVRLRLRLLDGSAPQYDRVFPAAAGMPAPQTLFLNCGPEKRHFVVYVDSLQAIAAPADETGATTAPAAKEKGK